MFRRQFDFGSMQQNISSTSPSPKLACGLLGLGFGQVYNSRHGLSSQGAGFESNQKVVGDHPNSHATISPVDRSWWSSWSCSSQRPELGKTVNDLSCQYPGLFIRKTGLQIFFFFFFPYFSFFIFVTVVVSLSTLGIRTILTSQNEFAQCLSFLLCGMV